MPLRFQLDDRSALGRIAARQAAESYRRNTAVSADLSSRIDVLYKAYPHLPAGQIYSFAVAGLDPTSEAVQQAADISFEQQRRDGGGGGNSIFSRVGDVVGTFVGKPLGWVASGVGHVGDAALGPVDEFVAPAVKGGVRTGFVVLESGLQEIQTFVRAAGYGGVHLAQEQGDTSVLNRLRNIVDPTRWDDQAREFGEAYFDAGSSSLRETITALTRGDSVDLGSGFMPKGNEDPAMGPLGVEARVRDRAGRLSMTVNDITFGGPGHRAITPGRIIASRVSEPGETQFNLISGLADGAAAWFGDPANALLAGAHNVRLGNRVNRGLRAAVGEGVPGFVSEVSHSGSFVNGGRELDRTLQGRAAEWAMGAIRGQNGARNTALPDVTEGWLLKQGRPIIDKMAESDFTEIYAKTKGKLGARTTVALADAQTPDEVVDILRPLLGAEVSKSPEFLGFKVRRANREGVRLLHGMPSAFLDPTDIDEAVRQIELQMRNFKVPAALRNEAMERVARVNGREEMVSVLDEIFGKVADHIAGGVKPGKFTTSKARARSLTTMFNKDLETTRAYFTDAIAEGRRTDGLVLAGEPADLQSPFMFSELLNSVIPMPDAREVRRATSTLARLVDNPFFERTVGVLDGLQGKWKQVALMRGAYTVRVVGEEQTRMATSGYDSMFAHPVSYISALLADPKQTRRIIGRHKFGTGRLLQTDILDESFAAADELKDALVKGQTKWSADGKIYDVNHVVIRRGDPGFERAWADTIVEHSSDPIARMLARAQGNIDGVKAWFFEGQGKQYRLKMLEHRPELGSRAAADAWIDQAWEIVKDSTQADPVLMDAIATGRFGGKRIVKPIDGARGKLEDGFRAYFDEVVGPEAVKGRRAIATARDGGEVAKAWDQATTWIFQHLMTKETNYLSRSPAFRQIYYRRIEEMLPFMDDATRAQALRSAEGVVDDAAFKRMAALEAVGENPKITDLVAADHLAKQHALDETKKLLYDASERSQFFDAFRLVFPFGEAWREVATRWAKIGVDNPKVFRRGQQIITAGEGNGLLHKDANGDEVFTFPLTQGLSKAVIGVPMPLIGKLSGMSLMTEVLPSVGPVVQVTAAAFLPTESEWNWARKIISPYGEQDYSQGILESFMPGYLKNLAQGLGAGDERRRAVAVSMMYDYVRTTGKYDESDPDQQAAMFEEARSLGNRLFLFRAAAQFFAPTSPIPETLLENPKGDDLLVRREVVADFHRLTNDEGLTYEEGIQAFVDRYGVELLAATEGMTKPISPILPVSKEASDWVRDHGGLVSDYPTTWGFFAPTNTGESFDYTEYGRQIASGERKALTFEQRADLANATVGRYLYEQAKKKVAANPKGAEREWLALVREKLREEYPGYGRMITGVPFGADMDRKVIPELKRALTDPRVRDTDQAKAIGLYLTARDQALAFADANYGTKLGSQAAAGTREWLANVGRLIAAEYPSFQMVFDRAFAREVE